MSIEPLVDSILESVSNTLRLVDPLQIDDFENAIIKANQIILAGKGRTGLQLKGFAMRLMHLGLKVHVVDEVTTPSLGRGDLLVIASGSGRTTALVGYAQKAHALGASLAFITGNLDSPIAKQANHIISIRASNSKAGKPIDNQTVLPMGSLFEHTTGLVCDLIIINLMEKLGVTEKQMEKRHANLE